MEIENLTNAEFVPLLGTFNFEHKSMGALGIPDEFSFRMDWTKGGEGQEVLREHIRSRTLIRVKRQGRQCQGILRFESGINTVDGLVVVEVA
jgi:hypothetical protein